MKNSLEWLEYYKQKIIKSNKTFRPIGFEIIEKELNDYFVYKQDYERVMKEKNSLLKEYAKTQNKLKAFEIIKEKRVSVELLLKSQDLRFYNYHHTGKNLTQEEYDLLKEVLL